MLKSLETNSFCDKINFNIKIKKFLQDGKEDKMEEVLD
jgi:hypothetical protein